MSAYDAVVNGVEWTVGELRAWRLAHRRARSRSWVDWYSLGFAAVLASVMGVSLISRVQFPLWSCGAGTCLAGVSLLPVLWVAVTIVVASSLASLAGPLAVSVAAGAWILPLPLDRVELLAPDVRRIVLIGAIAGLLSGVVLWLGTAPSPVWIVSCGAAGSLAVLAAVLAQQEGWRSLWRLGAAGMFALVVPGALGLAHLLPSLGMALMATAFLAALAWGCWTRARAGLASMTTSALVRQGQLRSSLAGAVSTADAGFVLDVVGLRLMGSPGRRSLGTHARTRWGALAGYEVRRLARRSPRLLLGFAAMLVVTLALPMAPTAVLAIAVVALVPSFGLMLTSLRKVAITPGLRRALGLTPMAQVTALATGAALAAVTWMVWSGALLVAAGLSAGPALLLAWSAGVGGLAGALRRIATPAPDFTGGIVLTEAGPVPVSALATALSGFGTAITVAGLVLAGAPPLLCALASTLALLWSVRAAGRAGRAVKS